MKIALMVNPWLLEDWLMFDEVLISLDGKGVPQIYSLKGESRYGEHLQISVSINCLIYLHIFFGCFIG